MTSATKLDEIIHVLVGGNVDFILVGGIAAMAHGLARVTVDVDVVHSRAPANLTRIVNTLRPYQPFLRNFPRELPFLWDEQTLQNGMNLTLTTTLGELDLLGEVSGGGNYEQLLPFSERLELFDCFCQCVTLEQLIILKRAAGRPKDIAVLAELKALLKARGKSEEK